MFPPNLVKVLEKQSNSKSSDIDLSDDAYNI